jgi:ABC-type uncharacterized transport system substrate-binding protein
MKHFLRPLLFLLAVCTILLLSDLQNRKGVKREKQKTRIAMFRINSNQVLIEIEDGVLDVIRKSDAFKKGNIETKSYCAEGDMPTANTIASNIVSEKFNMAVSISTPALQAMANANKAGGVLNVFCGIADPFSAGVGITGSAANQHPPHLVGIGTFQPVEGLFRIARLMNPDLKKVGVVWCTSEASSEACVKKARIICKELGIELVEVSVETASQVYEAALAVSSQGVEALWIGGDNVVESAMEMLVGAAQKSRIPVISNNPKHVFKGAMINLGANYFEVGQIAGKMVVDLINGLPPVQIEIKNIVPEKLFINDSVRMLMKDKWIIPKDLFARADSVIYAI